MTRFHHACILALGAFISTGALAQDTPATQPAQDRSASEAGKPGMMGPEMVKNCQAMAEHHEKMLQQRNEMDQRLQQQIQAVDAATGDQKIDAMAAALKELVQQKTQMHQHMAGMMPMMGMHMMMAHGGEGMDMQKMMSECPMMKQMMQGGGMHGMQGGRAAESQPGSPAAATPAAGEHSSHHPD
jgi:hypothetical protein